MIFVSYKIFFYIINLFIIINKITPNNQSYETSERRINIKIIGNGKEVIKEIK